MQQQSGLCCWCGKAMLTDVHETHPEFATFEHILPQVHGGTDSMSNLLLAHRKCNRERGHDCTVIPLFCWARRQLGTDRLKIVKYLDNDGISPLRGPKRISDVVLFP